MRRVALAAACVVVACSDGSPPTAALRPSPDSRSSSVSAGVTQSASGSAIRWTGGEPFIQSFVANKHAHGTVRGGFHADAKSLNARFNVNVTCLSIEGNRAWIGGIISDSDTPLVQPGLASYFYVIDVGEGAIGAIQQDIVSALRINDAPGAEQTFCADRPTTLPSRRIEDGNVQVRE